MMSTNQSAVEVQPYLFFGGRCEEALEFYGRATGAEAVRLVRFKDAPQPQPGLAPGNETGQTTFMASDGRCGGQPSFDGLSMSVTVPEDAEAQRVFDALSEGGKIEMSLTQTFWASKFGRLEDKFGVGWMASVEHKRA